MRNLPLAAQRTAAALVSLVSWTGFLLKLGVGALGDIQAVSAAKGTDIMLIKMMLQVPTWAYASMAVVTLVTLLWSLIRETNHSVARLDAFKAANDNAWAFSAEFNAVRDKMALMHTTLDQTLNVFTKNLEQNNRARQELSSSLQSSLEAYVYRKFGESHAELRSLVRTTAAEESRRTYSLLTRYVDRISASAMVRIDDRIKALEHQLQSPQDTDTRTPL